MLRPIKVTGPIDLSGISGDELPLLDSDTIGGTGAAFAWEWVEGVTRPFVLAGGLSPENVSEAVAQVQPWGVDASSGLESAPGIKDLAKVVEFVQQAKAI